MQSAAVRLRENADRIMAQWEARATQEVQAALGLTTLVLRDKLLTVITDLADALTSEKQSPEEIAKGVAARFTTAAFHGEERAAIDGFTLAEVIFEFHILRQVMFEVLEDVEPIQKRERDIIIDSFEQTVNDSASAFVKIQREHQERYSLILVHDFRNPLNVIKMSTQLARIQSASAPSVHQTLERIEKSVSRLEAMIRELLDVGQLKYGTGFRVELKEMRFDEFVKDVGKQLVELYGDRVAVQADVPIKGCLDSDGLRRIIENLVVNALKYGSPTAQVTIRAEQNTDSALLIVHNEGNPISPKDQASIFAPFRRANHAKSATGWGLGLAFVKGMAQAHKGSVRVDSTPERGTNFIVELPRMYSSATTQCVGKPKESLPYPE